ncbi:metallophosphoesterase [Bradyrhizobium cenepequi]|uniref:metallophosphoesterase n=1 Tax=Bradyrhizobium cenepequi TaxID=2821403 RepID=UPI001CE32BB1|nr:metallophosphoesterase [Bradyrhizobium cenepequi]MCA6112809.1 metallophosphoesterase [Bradyrhizobium cenepequi]
MKIVLLPDLHVTEKGGLVRGIDPIARLDSCVAAIQRLVADADLCVTMGDNVENGRETEYLALLDCLKPLRMPIRFLAGNHDDRDTLLKVMPEVEQDQSGYIQSALETEREVLLFLDTAKARENSGDYCDEKLTWLNQQLKQAGQKSVYLFMHHPPFRTGLWNDHSRVRDADKFLAAVTAARNVKHILLGHTHRASSGSWNGLAWTTIEGTCYANDFELLPAKPNYLAGPAQIGILLLNGGESVLHFQEVLGTYPLIEYSGRSIRDPELSA